MCRLVKWRLEGNAVRWIQKWLENHAPKVFISYSSTNWKEVSGAVLQRSVLGPVLLNLFIEDSNRGTFLDPRAAILSVQLSNHNIAVVGRSMSVEQQICRLPLCDRLVSTHTEIPLPHASKRHGQSSRAHSSQVKTLWVQSQARGEIQGPDREDLRATFRPLTPDSSLCLR